jgi:hypothetical protein
MKKTFDCVAMMHEAQQQVMAEVQGMTPAQEAAWHQARAAEIMAHWREDAVRLPLLQAYHATGVKRGVKKGFDCVKMKHDAQRQIMAETAGMTHEELAAWYHARAEEIQAKWAADADANPTSRSRKHAASGA